MAHSDVGDSRVRFIGLPLDALTFDETVERLTTLVERKTFAQHVVINAGKMVLVDQNPELRAIIEGCDLVSADGQSIVWASRLLGIPVPERVAGIDLMEALLKKASDKGYPVYFLGARREALEQFVDVVHHRFPELVIAGFHDGYFADDESMARSVADSKARILFVGISSPRKEQFLAEQAVSLGPLLALGVGGSFDVWAGLTSRAPHWMQRAGLEWFYRLIQEPRRMWKRYLVGNTRFVLMVLRERLRGSTT